MYLEKINKIYNKYVEDFKRKDETFEMLSIRYLIEKLESGNYDKEIQNITSENVEAFCNFLYQEYLETMYRRYEYLNNKD